MTDLAQYTKEKKEREKRWRRILMIVTALPVAMIIYMVINLVAPIFSNLPPDATPTVMVEEALAPPTAMLFSRGETIQFDDPELAYGLCYDGKFRKLGPSRYECEGP